MVSRDIWIGGRDLSQWEEREEDMEIFDGYLVRFNVKFLEGKRKERKGMSNIEVVHMYLEKETDL